MVVLCDDVPIAECEALGVNGCERCRSVDFGPVKIRETIANAFDAGRANAPAIDSRAMLAGMAMQGNLAAGWNHDGDAEAVAKQAVALADALLAALAVKS